MGEERPNSQQATTPRRSLTQIVCFALFLGPAQTLHPPSRACACARRRLSSRLDDIKKTACGDGHSHCLLCGAAFGPQGLAPVLCVHCKNVGGLLPPRSHREGLRGAPQRSLHHRVEVSCGNERPALRAHVCFRDFTYHVVLQGAQRRRRCSLERKTGCGLCTCHRGLCALTCLFASWQNICSKCGIHSNSRACPVWLCSICQEQQEVRGSSYQGHKIK